MVSEMVRILFPRRWFVFRKWGRVGTKIGGAILPFQHYRGASPHFYDGRVAAGRKMSEFHAAHTAEDDFCAVFTEKTGNSWDSDTFVKVPFAPQAMHMRRSCDVTSRPCSNRASSTRSPSSKQS